MQVEHASKLRAAITQHLEQLLGNDAVLAVPSAPGPAPFLNTLQQELNAFRQRLISLTCIAGLSGLPQVCPLSCGVFMCIGSIVMLITLFPH